MGAADDLVALETRRAERIAAALKDRGVTFTFRTEDGRTLLDSVDSNGVRRGCGGTVKNGETIESVRRRLLWTLAIDVEHDATGCACTGGRCPAAKALQRRLSEAA